MTGEEVVFGTMRIFLFTPVAYVAGIEGFGIFLPYLAFIALMMLFARNMKKRSRKRPGAAIETAFLPAGLLELEAAAR
jgi:hypothetical protein